MDGDGMPPPPPGGDPEMVGEPGGPEFGPAEGPPPGEPDGPPPGADMDGDGMPPPPPGEGEYDPEYSDEGRAGDFEDPHNYYSSDIFIGCASAASGIDEHDFLVFAINEYFKF